jgi:hypothetical protein
VILVPFFAKLNVVVLFVWLFVKLATKCIKYVPATVGVTLIPVILVNVVELVENTVVLIASSYDNVELDDGSVQDAFPDASDVKTNPLVAPVGIWRVPPILTVPASTFNANPDPPVVTVGAPAIVNVFAVPVNVEAVVTGAAKYVNDYVDAPVNAVVVGFTYIVPVDIVVDPAPLNVVVAFKIDAAPAYRPPATCRAPVELLVEAVVLAKVNVDDAPVNAKTADVPCRVTFALNNEFAPAYRPPATCRAPVELLVEAVVLAKVTVDDAPDNASTADVPFNVTLAANNEFAPKYPPPATLNAPVVLLVDAAVFAKVNADVAPDNAKIADAPCSVTFALNNEFAPAYRPPATCKAPVVLLVDAAVFAKVNADVAPVNASTADVPFNVTLPAVNMFPAKILNAKPVPPVVTVGAPAIVNVVAVPENVDAVVTGAAKYVNEYVDAPVSAVVVGLTYIVPDDIVVDPAAVAVNVTDENVDVDVNPAVLVPANDTYI